MKGRDYDKIWNREHDESPLKTITRAQAEKLAAHFAGIDSGVWSNGACATAIPRSKAGSGACCRRMQEVMIVPLYPQYAAAMMATLCGKAFEALAKMR